MLELSHLQGIVKIPAYGDKYYLLDSDNNILSEEDATQVVTNSLFSLLTSCLDNHLYAKVETHIAAKRPFTLGASYYEDKGKHYLYPLFNYEAINALKSEMTMYVHNHNSVRVGPQVSIYPLKKSVIPTDEEDVQSMSRFSVTTLNDALSMAKAAGAIAAFAYVKVYPQHVKRLAEEIIVRGKEHIWRKIKTLEFHDNPLSREDRLKCLRWLTPIDNQTFLKAQSTSHIYLGRTVEIDTFLATIGLRNECIQTDIFAEHEHDYRESLPPNHPDRVKEMEPLTICFSDEDTMSKIKEKIVLSSKLKEIVSAATGCDNHTAEKELEKAFDSGVNWHE